MTKKKPIIVKMKESTVDVETINNEVDERPYLVNRKILKQVEIEEATRYDRHIDTPTQMIRKKFRAFKLRDAIVGLFPVLDWLPKYKIRESFMGDLIAGITVGIMHIPQGLAYGLLAGLDPIVGLYMAFFPTLVYVLFGTSRHISPGTFAIASIMTSQIVFTYSDPNYGTENPTMNPSYSAYQVATAVTMICGIFQLLMCVLRLGALASLLSSPLISGFTTAAAVHVIVAQAKDLLGVSIPRHSGSFKVIFSVRDIILNISTSNPTTIYVSIGCVGFMIFMNEIVKPWASKKCKFAIPAELMCVVGSTIISYLLKLSEEPSNVLVVGKVPTGLPYPTLPPIELLSAVAVDSIAVCVVTLSIMISMGLVFAKKDKYEVKPNQELLAIGLSNIIGSFFSCIPLCTSLSRSVIQYQIGGKTQITSVVSAVLILTLLLWLGPLFEVLPRATLASIILVALKGLIWQVKDLKTLSKESRLDVIVWIVTFLTVIIIDIDVGLLAGALVSLFILYLKGFKSYSCMLGQVPNTDIYVDLKTHQNVNEITGTKIFRYYGSINFATCSSFKKSLCDSIGIDCQMIKKALEFDQNSENRDFYNSMKILILDLTAVHHIDMSGYRTFIEIRNDLRLLETKVLLAGASDCVYDILMKASSIGEASIECYPTLHDAVLASANIP